MGIRMKNQNPQKIWIQQGFMFLCQVFVKINKQIGQNRMPLTRGVPVYSILSNIYLVHFVMGMSSQNKLFCYFKKPDLKKKKCTGMLKKEKEFFLKIELGTGILYMAATGALRVLKKIFNFGIIR